MDKGSQIEELCLYDYRSLPTGDQPSGSSRPPARQYRFHLESQIANGNTTALDIELAMRYLAGTEFENRPCEEGALFFLDPIVNPQREIPEDWDPATDSDGHNPSTEALSAQAHSIAAYAYFRKYMACPDELRAIVRDRSDDRFPRMTYQTRADDQLENILCAARHATHAAAIDFVSPAVLIAGFAFKTLVERVDLDLARIPLYRPLWRALDRWQRDLSAEETGGGKAPERNEEACGAAGCTRTTQHGGGPRGWGCECASDLKPWYCSKECQDIDWLNHQKTCAMKCTIPPPFTIMSKYGVLSAVLKGMMVLTEPIEHLEILTDDEDLLDPRNGTMLCDFDLPCPFGTPDREVHYVLKRYDLLDIL
ncbi:hypothetical protein C2E23DRAFT_720157 [Lenzites betulinus]|nr:hypothetical protein C2E23DRAFT_720157 [Lenzites betulinus]